MRYEQDTARLEENHMQVKHIEKEIQSLYFGKKLQAFIAILFLPFLMWLNAFLIFGMLDLFGLVDEWRWWADWVFKGFIIVSLFSTGFAIFGTWGSKKDLLKKLGMPPET